MNIELEILKAAGKADPAINAALGKPDTVRGHAEHHHLHRRPACLPAVDASCVQPFDVYLNQLQDEVHRHRCVNCL